MGRPALAAGFLDARHLKDDLQAAARTANLTGKKQPERSATTQTRNWVWACREHADIGRNTLCNRLVPFRLSASGRNKFIQSTTAPDVGFVGAAAERITLAP